MAKLGRNPKPITREQLLAAMKMTKSNMACARYLGISYMHYSRYAKSYIDEETGKTLFDLHKNQSGKGIPKFLDTFREKSSNPSTPNNLKFFI